MFGHKIHGQILFGLGTTIWYYFDPELNYGSISLIVNFNCEYDEDVSTSEVNDI